MKATCLEQRQFWSWISHKNVCCSNRAEYALKLRTNDLCLEDKKIINKFSFQGKYQENELRSEFKIINWDSVRYIK